jgi:hypothetical protein
MPLRLPFPLKFQRLAEKLAIELQKKEQAKALHLALTTSPNRPFQDFRPKMARKKRGGRGRPRNQGPVQPSEVSTNSVVKSVYRFSSTAAQVQVAVLIKTLLEMQGIVQTDATHYQGVFSCVRLKKIEIWTPSSVAGHTDSFIRWSTGGNNIVDDVRVNATVGSANASYYSTSPPKGSFSSMWWDSTAAAVQLFDITCGAGSIIDITAEGRLRNSIAQPATTVTAVAKTVGTLFFGYLDGVTGNFIPEGRPS